MPHLSLSVQGLPSSQLWLKRVVPVEQAPDAGLHVPALWHEFEGVQTTGFPPVHAPAEQVSVCVQPLPSLQAAPLAITVAAVCTVAEGQLPRIAFTPYVPEFAVVAPAMEGFCSDDPKPPGPVQLYVAPGIVDALSCNVAPAQMGPLFVTTGFDGSPAQLLA